MNTATPQYHPVGRWTTSRSHLPSPKWWPRNPRHHRPRNSCRKWTNTQSPRNVCTVVNTLTRNAAGKGTVQKPPMKLPTASISVHVFVRHSVCYIIVCQTQRGISHLLVLATPTRVSSVGDGLGLLRYRLSCPAYGAILLSNAATGLAQSVVAAVADTKRSDFGTDPERTKTCMPQCCHVFYCNWTAVKTRECIHAIEMRDVRTCQQEI